MALIECPECSKTVSNTAAACPQCGAPIAQAAAERVAIGTPLSTIQQTSKRLKMHIVISVILWWTSVIWLIFAASAQSQSQTASQSVPGLPIAIFLISSAWYILTKLRIWWHHK